MVSLETTASARRRLPRRDLRGGPRARHRRPGRRPRRRRRASHRADLENKSRGGRRRRAVSEERPREGDPHPSRRRRRRRPHGSGGRVVPATDSAPLHRGRPRRRHRGARDGAQWPGRARVRTDGGQRSARYVLRVSSRRCAIVRGAAYCASVLRTSAGVRSGDAKGSITRTVPNSWPCCRSSVRRTLHWHVCAVATMRASHQERE